MQVMGAWSLLLGPIGDPAPAQAEVNDRRQIAKQADYRPAYKADALDETPGRSSASCCWIWRTHDQPPRRPVPPAGAAHSGRSQL